MDLFNFHNLATGIRHQSVSDSSSKWWNVEYTKACNTKLENNLTPVKSDIIFGPVNDQFLHAWS